MAKKKGKKVAGNTLKWLLALFMFSGCMVYWFSFASIIFALLGIYFLPIAPIQNFFKNFMPKKKILRGIIAFVIFFFGCLIAPATETTTPETPSTDIVISSDESKVVLYQKRFRVQNSSITGTLQYRKDGQVRNIPAGSFVPFEMESTYNRIGTVAVSDGGQFELRLRSEYRYDWMTDKVNFQYVEDGVTYIRTFTNLNTLNDFSGPIILDPVQ
jgi:hypothetical protein